MPALVRRLLTPDYIDQQLVAPAANERGEGLVAQALPERSELVRLGASWGAQIPTGSAFTFVAAWPTTRAELVLSNGEQASGKTYIIDRVYLANITGAGLGVSQPYSLLGQLVPASQGVGPVDDNPAIFRQSLSGKFARYGGKAALAMASTAFALADHWAALGNSVMLSMPTTNLGGSMEAFVYGRYLVPPGGAFCLAGLAGTAAGTAICGIEWHEFQISAQ